MYNPTNGVLEYMESLSPQSAASAPPMQFKISPVMPRVRENPKINFMKLLIMLGGAVAAGLLYERIIKMRPGVMEYEWREENPDFSPYYGSDDSEAQENAWD